MSRSKEAAAKMFAELHREMELTAPSKSESGQNVKRHPRHLLPELTKKRKSLEQADRSEMAVEVEDDGKRRMRGSKVAFEDVVLNSMPMMVGGNSVYKSEEDGNLSAMEEEEEDYDDAIDADDILDDVDELGINIDDEDEDFDEYQDDDSGEDDDGYDNMEEDAEQDQTVDAPRLPAVSATEGQNNGEKRKTTRKSTAGRRRKIYRLRDFASHRLALRHGEALGAHIRGDSETAVQKLTEVAKAAPGAPQVYSSLGMVYESMLEDLEKKNNADGGSMSVQSQQRRLELANKTYASLHIAAVLCKRDFTLWERSGDTAMRLVHMYNAMIDNADSSEQVDEWQKERTQWIDHALSAYTSADNLRPPGVDVPCKLARVHIEVGNFIDALSIVTGLRSRGSLEGSYPCWLLYADLMMKIGFECKMWNLGTSTGQSYMAKRWLRKYSVTFDWKERRLQALCLALEAAAGSKSCAELSKRMKKRTNQLFVDEAGKDNEQDNSDPASKNDESAEIDSETAANADATDQQQEHVAATTAESSEPVAKTKSYEEERCSLVKRNEIELQKFDWKSNGMNLIEGSHVHRDRMAARAALIEKHRESIRDLARRSINNTQQTVNEPKESTQSPSDDDDAEALQLPLQASCATVCQIAALLLTQCVQSKLYDDGLVAARSVLSYYKERIARHKQRLDKLERRRTRSKPSQGYAQPGFDYDTLNFESDESDADDPDPFISDEEDLDQPEYLDALHKGILPVDIRAFYSLCLVGAGGQDFLAMSYLEKVMVSDELELVDSDVCKDSNNAWTLFRTQFNLDLNKTSFLALIVDIVKSKTLSQRHKLEEMLRLHLSLLDKKHGLDQIVSSTDKRLKANALKILFASLKMMLESAEMDLESFMESNKSDPEALKNVVGRALAALNTIIRFQHVFWHPNSGIDSSLPTASLETMGIISSAMSILSHVLTISTNDKDMIKAILLKAQLIINLICDARNSDIMKTSDERVSESWTSFPLPCDWQSSFHRSLSTLAYNLCVGCCVSSFSGWSNDEFNLDLLHSRVDSNIFGLNMDGSCVAGFLSSEAEISISRQWEHINQLLPNLEVLRYQAQLNQRKDKEWYKTIKRHAKHASKIAAFKEDEGVITLLSFSAICLVAGENSDDAGEKDCLLRIAMSVILPMTRFSIDKDVWDAKIGSSAINEINETSIGYYVDENLQWLGPTKDARKSTTSQSNPKQLRDQFTRRTLSKPRSTVRRTNRTGFFGIQISTSVMLSEWNQDELREPRSDASADARFAMSAVDSAMKNLKKSRTIAALERSSLDVAAGLVKVASFEECHNPFLCLQQAAIYAAMGQKLGNSDEPFKAFLPLQKKCTALNALVILGRADCLRAIHFLESAQFLCSWVAKVCSLCRSHLEDELPWTSRWKVIGAYLSFVAANIDGTASEIGTKLSDWEEVVKQEISYGKADATMLLNSRKYSIDEASKTDDLEVGSIHHDVDTPQSFKSTAKDEQSVEFDMFGDDIDDQADGNDDFLFENMNWAPV